MPVLTSRISALGLGGVALPLGLHDPLDRSGAVAHDAPVAGGVLRGRSSPSSRPRRRRCGRRSAPQIASALTSGTSPLSTTTGEVASSVSPSWAMAAATAPPVPSGRSCTASLHPVGQDLPADAPSASRPRRSFRRPPRRRPARATAASAGRTARGAPSAWPSACACPGRRPGSGRSGRSPEGC